MCARSLIGEDSEGRVVLLERKTKLDVDKRQMKKERRRAMLQYRQEEKADGQTQKGEHYQDLLARLTIKHHDVVCALSQLLSSIQQTKFYRVLFLTTQPAHVVTLVAVLTVAMLVYPASGSAPQQDSARPSALIHLIYLASFMFHFGAQMWMTFISGLTLYFAVPRHTFGEVQKVLFPKYFGINSFLSLVTLVIFVKLHPTESWDTAIMTQVGAMVLCFLLELIIRLYFAPPLLKLMAAKNAIERAAGVGTEVGKHNPGALASCPHYVKMHKAFRKIHMTVAIGNMLAMACTALHLHYLSHKICVL